MRADCQIHVGRADLIGTCFTMKVLWICGLPEDVRLNALSSPISHVRGAAWSWVLGHLPPPKDVELHIVCPVLGLTSKRLDFTYRGAHWHCFRQGRNELAFLWFRLLFRIRPFVRGLRPEIIHGWGGETGCGWLATCLSKHAVVSVQGLLLLFWQMLKSNGGMPGRRGLRTRISWFIERQTYRRAEKLLVESEAAQSALKEYYGLEGVLVSHPLRAEFADFDLSTRRMSDAQHIKIVFIGTLIGRKGAADAVKAFALLHCHDASLVMIGDGAEREEIEDIIRGNRLTSRVCIKNGMSAAEIVNEFRNANYFLLPSYGDTGPTALKEALACGVYPICYDNSGPGNLIRKYHCGSLVSTGDVAGLASTLSLCLKKMRANAENAVVAAKKIRGELCKENVWRHLMDHYTSLTGFGGVEPVSHRKCKSR